MINGSGFANVVLTGGSGSGAADNINGTPADDTLSGGGGADVIYGGAGSDILQVADLGFSRLDGGRGNPLTGMDALQLTGFGQVLDLTALNPGLIQGIEMIDLNDRGNQLNLDAAHLLQLSRETNELYVSGGGSDRVTVDAGDVWTGEGTSGSYSKYISGGAILFIDSLVQQAGISQFSGTQRYNLNTTASGANVTADISNFPVLVRITDSAIIDNSQSDARDIRFADPSGNPLDYEVERWDQVNDVAEVWVKVPTVFGNTNGANSSTQNFFVMSYGGGPAMADAQNPAALWSDYKAVYHLAETSGSADAIDATGNGNTAVSSGGGTVQQRVAGLGRRFSSNYSMTAASSGSNLGTTGGPFTISAWIEEGSQYTSWNSPSLRLISRGNSGDHWALNNYYFNFVYQLVSESFTYGNGSSSGTLSLDASGFGGWGGSWEGPLTLFTVVFTGTRMEFYVNGATLADSSATTIDLNNANDLIFGLSGVFYDEIRLGDFAMSPAAIRLAYENQRPSGQSLISAQ